MSSLDGERAWRDVVNRIDDSTKTDFFRLNVAFEGAEPLLDDIQCIDTLRRSVHLQPQGARERTDVASALLIASFYFELEVLPKFQAGQYLCTGMIRCRNDFDSVFKSLSRIHTSPLRFMTETENLGMLNMEDVCNSCHLYHKRIQFFVRQLDDAFSIFIKFNSLERRKISGFPQSMGWFARQQQLDAPFGRVDHDRTAVSSFNSCVSHDTDREGQKKPGKRRAIWPGISPKRTKRY